VLDRRARLNLSVRVSNKPIVQQTGQPRSATSAATPSASAAARQSVPRQPPDISRLSQEDAKYDRTGEWLVELRGFEPLTTAEQAHARGDAAAASKGGRPGPWSLPRISPRYHFCGGVRMGSQRLSGGSSTRARQRCRNKAAGASSGNRENAISACLNSRARQACSPSA
jgi:hypothetical protein